VRDQLGEAEGHVVAGVRRPKGAVERDLQRQVSLLSRQASPSSSGVTATGEKALAGFDW
jgi:hypothetical protein